jgi:DNA-binding beta-propeller fold protein YncE
VPKLPLLLLLLAACTPEPDDTTDTTVDATSPVIPECVDPAANPAGTICTIAGVMNLAKVSAEGLPANEAELYLPIDMTMGPDGLLYVIDWNNHRIRRIDADGTMNTLAGTGTLGDGPQGPAFGASFNHPTNLTFDPADPNKLYIAAWHNSRIEILDLAADTVTFVAGTGDRKYNGESQPAEAAMFDLPSAVVFDDDGTLLVSDTANQILRRIDADGLVKKFAGTEPEGELDNGQTDRRYGWEGDNGPAVNAKFNMGWGQKGYPGGRIEKDGRTLYVADSYNFVVRAIDLDTGVISHIAGTGLLHGYSGDGGAAATASMEFPADLASDHKGNLYVADTFNHCIRKIDADGIITTVAGVCAEPGADGDGGPATEAHLLNPYGVEITDDWLYIADTENHVIRAVKL